MPEWSFLLIAAIIATGPGIYAAYVQFKKNKVSAAETYQRMFGELVADYEEERKKCREWRGKYENALEDIHELEKQLRKYQEKNDLYHRR